MELDTSIFEGVQVRFGFFCPLLLLKTPLFHTVWSSKPWMNLATLPKTHIHQRGNNPFPPPIRKPLPSPNETRPTPKRNRSFAKNSSHPNSYSSNGGFSRRE